MVQLLDNTRSRVGVRLLARAGGPLEAVLRAIGRPSSRFVVTAMVLAGITATLVSHWLTAAPVPPVLVGLPDAGAFTRVGLPVAQFVQELAGIAVVGVLFVRCLTATRRPEPVVRHLQRVASRWAWLWLAGATALLLLTLSELAGVPVAEVLSRPELMRALIGTDRVMAGAMTLWVALLLVLFTERVSGAPGSGLLTVAAAGALLPGALTGHAAHHNNAIMVSSISLGIHIVAASIWIGGLLALVVHLRKFPEQLRRAIPRFSAAALVCVAAVGASGLLAGILMLDGWAALWTSSRGHLILAKTGALVMLVLIGHLHRKRTLAAACSGRLWPLIRLGAVELSLMGVTLGIAVVLSTTA
jgi:putative copper export protein